MSSPILEIQDALRAGRVVPVVGAGVSVAAASLPDWAGLIESGLAHAEGVSDAGGPPISTPVEAEATRADLRAGRLPEAAARVKAMLGAPGGEYALWLRRTFDVPRSRVTRHATLNAIADLMCPLMASTNYDRLLSTLHPDRPQTATWQQSLRLQVALREGGAVIHLHGVFDEPESVVFGVHDYDALIGHGAYKAVLQTLWLERVLLFVGCSFEGLRDPDFAALRAWAAREFGGRPYKHYALRRTGSFDGEESKRLLREERIHAVPFGPSFDDLPEYLATINPRRAEARQYRLTLAREIAGASDPHVLDPTTGERVEDLLRGALRAADQQGNEQTVVAVARQLLEDKQRRHAMLRGDLQALQQFMAGIVSREVLREQIARWEARQVWRYDDPFADAVRRARQALGLLVPQFLLDLHRRGVPISSAILSDYALSYVDTLEKGDSYSADLRYALENAKRVLESALAILEADPERVFPDARPGTGSISELADLLLVVREDRLELRELPGGDRVVAELPSDEPLHQAEVAPLGGWRVVLVRGRESLFAWDPVRAASPTKVFRIQDAFGTFDATHFVDVDGVLRSFLVTVEGTLYELRDLEEQDQWSSPESDLGSLACLPDGRLFALHRSRLPVVEILAGHNVVWRLVPEDLDGIIAGLPGLELYWPEKMDRESKAGARPWLDRDGRYQHVYLRTGALDGRPVLLLKATLSFATEDDDVVLLLSPQGEGLTPVGAAYLPGKRILRFTLTTGPDGRPRLVFARLSDFEEGHDLVEWVRGTPTSRGLIFQAEGSTLRTYDDMVCVAMLDFDRGFASDDSGGLFAFSPSSRTYGEIDRNRKSRIRGLVIVGPSERTG